MTIIIAILLGALFGYLICCWSPRGGRSNLETSERELHVKINGLRKQLEEAEQGTSLAIELTNSLTNYETALVEQKSFNIAKRRGDRAELYNSATDSIKDVKAEIEKTMASDPGCYLRAVKKMESILKRSDSDSKKLLEMSQGLVNADFAVKLARDWKKSFDDFYGRILILQSKYMMSDDYGIINQALMDKATSMNRQELENYVNGGIKVYSTGNYMERDWMEGENAILALWFFATEKPYSPDSLNNAKELLAKLVGGFEAGSEVHPDYYLSELYALAQMGGESVLKDRVKEILSIERVNSDPKLLTYLASGLMWLKQYDVEYTVLEMMLDKKMPMSKQLQERLRMLSGAGKKGPVIRNISTSDKLVVDITSLSWRKDDYNTVFDELAFRSRRINYSLAIRLEDKDILLQENISIPDIDTMVQKLSELAAREYGSSVSVEKKAFTLLTTGGEESAEAVLLRSNEHPAMGMLVHTISVGKKYDIKCYTVFLPDNEAAAEQKKKAVELFEKLSPAGMGWEKSIKETVLIGIQQLLNSTAIKQAETVVADDEEVIF